MLSLIVGILWNATTCPDHIMTEIIQPNRTMEEERQLVNIYVMMGVETLVPSLKDFQCRSLRVNSVVQQVCCHVPWCRAHGSPWKLGANSLPLSDY